MTKYLKPSVFILSLFPFLIITYKIFFNKLGPEPVKEITHFTGEWTLIFICLTLSMSPLKKFTKLSLWINFRRMLGLFVFFYATLHLLTYVGLDYRFDWQPILDDVVKKKYIFIGFNHVLNFIICEKLVLIEFANGANLNMAKKAAEIISIFSKRRFLLFKK